MSETMNVEDIYKRVGSKVKALRRQAKMTQTDLATCTKVGRTSLVNFESGRQRLSLVDIETIALALNTPLHELLYNHQETK